MKGISLKGLLLFLLLVTIIVTSNFESCNARRGKHWRSSRMPRSSMYRRKTKWKNGGGSSNRHHHYAGGDSSHGKQHGSSSKATPVPAPVPAPTPVPKSTPSPAPSPRSSYKQPSIHATVFNVLDYGAKGDGTSDDTKVVVVAFFSILYLLNAICLPNIEVFTCLSWEELFHTIRTMCRESRHSRLRTQKMPLRVMQAFQAAWAMACKVEASTILVPSDYVFLVGPISFSGPYCQPNIVFQLDGTIVAPTSSKAWGSGLMWWLDFTKLRGLTIKGNGIVEGKGSVWWRTTQFDFLPISNQLVRMMPSIKPTAIRFYGSYNVTVTGITIQNSPQCHLKFDDCEGVEVYNMTISSPADSLNTDGIHLQNSKNVAVHHNQLACGDDCISIQTGCSNINIHHVNCGPGHGISIGGLGRDNTKACVSNITVQNVFLQGTMTGVRIKTWQGGLGSVQNVRFSNIKVTEVQTPIVIDQFYCDKQSCKNQTTAVALSGISYESIKGTFTIKPVHFACSDSFPCSDVSLTDIELVPQQERYHMYDPFCWQAYGQLRTPTQPPIDCLQAGKPARNQVQSDPDTC